MNSEEPVFFSDRVGGEVLVPPSSSDDPASRSVAAKFGSGNSSKNILLAVNMYVIESEK